VGIGESRRLEYSMGGNAQEVGVRRPVASAVEEVAGRPAVSLLHRSTALLQEGEEEGECER
jgi:hypothetical protein